MTTTSSPEASEAGMPRVTEPGQLAAVVPYQLGYVPASSIVVVGVHDVAGTATGGLRLVTGGVGRVDLPRTPADADVVARSLVQCLASMGAQAAFVFLYSAVQVAPGAPPLAPFSPLCPTEVALDALDALASQCQEAGIAIVEELYVHDGRWLPFGCVDEDCCPVEGHLLPDPLDVGAVAHFVAEGSAPVEDRTQVVATCLAGTDPLADAVARELPRARAAQARRPVTSRTVLRRWHDALVRPATSLAVDPRREEPLPSAAVIARLVVELESDDDPAGATDDQPVRSLRDAVLTWCDPDDGAFESLPPHVRGLAMSVLGPCTTPDLEQRRQVVERLCALVRAVPPADCANVSGLLAAVAWRSGDPVRARTAAEQALAVMPGHRLAQLVCTALDHALPPRRPASAL